MFKQLIAFLSQHRKALIAVGTVLAGLSAATAALAVLQRKTGLAGKVRRALGKLKSAKAAKAEPPTPEDEPEPPAAEDEPEHVGAD
jgi:hypothetical protein